MGFFDRLANAWNIFVTSLLFILKDKSLLIIPFLLIFSVVFFCILFVWLIYSPSILSFVLLFNAIIFIFIMYLWTTFLSAAQSWMVHEVAQDKDATLISGFKRSIKNIFDIILFAIVKLLIGLVVGSLRRKYGRVGHTAGGFIELITGIAGKLVIPAMIITERSFIESVKQLGQAIKVIPEIATFEIGIRPLTGLLTGISLGFLAIYFLTGSIIAVII